MEPNRRLNHSLSLTIPGLLLLVAPESFPFGWCSSVFALQMGGDEARLGVSARRHVRQVRQKEQKERSDSEPAAVITGQGVGLVGNSRRGAVGSSGRRLDTKQYRRRGSSAAAELRLAPATLAGWSCLSTDSRQGGSKYVD